MIRALIPWALLLAVAAFALQWLEYRYLVHALPKELYIGVIGTAFAAGGVWVGWKLAARPTTGGFERNDLALKALGLTGQEIKVLERLAAGQSNKEIAKVLGLSPNTVKTHIANLFGKLEVSRRTQAVNKARDLRLIP